MTISPLHVRMARAALRWSLKDLAERSDVNLNTISRYEAGKEVLSGTLQRIEKTLADAGILFFEKDDQFGPGVRLRNPPVAPKKQISVSERKRR